MSWWTRTTRLERKRYARANKRYWDRRRRGEVIVEFVLSAGFMEELRALGWLSSEAIADRVEVSVAVAGLIARAISLNLTMGDLSGVHVGPGVRPVLDAGAIQVRLPAATLKKMSEKGEKMSLT